MLYAICHLGIVPIRAEPSDKSEMVSQVLYGDFFKVLEKRKSWSKVRIAFDGYEGWIDNKQYQEISEEHYYKINSENLILNDDIVEFVTDQDKKLHTIPIGSVLNGINLLNHLFEGSTISGKKEKKEILNTAFLYLNSPYLWGGKTPFGIDCSGFTQMVYKLNGHKLKRDASQQARQGTALSFIEESNPGDLAFFDNGEGEIIHVGLIMENNYIIHAHGKVRIDRLDHTGIFDAERNVHTHKLRVIKKIF